MAYRVRVKDGKPLAGYRGGNQRLNILPGEYRVEREGQVLRFVAADQAEGGDLLVRIDEYITLAEFPRVHRQAPLDVLGEI